MVSLEEKADSGPAVDLAGSLLETQYRLKDLELVPADEIGSDEFPQYGDYGQCEARSPVDGTFRGERYVEIPEGLAQFLLKAEVTTDDWWQVTEHKKVDGRHQYEVEMVDD